MPEFSIEDVKRTVELYEMFVDREKKTLERYRDPERSTGFVDEKQRAGAIANTEDWLRILEVALACMREKLARMENTMQT